MPLRVGANGGIAKPSSFPKIRRNTRPTQSQVIDLTRASTDETNVESSREGSVEEKRDEDALEHYEEGRDRRGRYRNSGAGIHEITLGARQATLDRSQINNGQIAARQAQRFVLEDSFMVTSENHRPWGMGDEHTAIGVFSTEREAKDAAFEDFHQRCESQADGWEHEWRRRPGDDMLQLHGICEDGEDDQYRYAASIKPVQNKRATAVQADLPDPVQPQPGPVKPRYVYVVKIKQREHVGAGPQEFDNQGAELKGVRIHDIFEDLNAANDGAREVYQSLVKRFRGDVEIIEDMLRDRMAVILVWNPRTKNTYFISVIKKTLR